MHASYQILCYVKGSPDYGILIHASNDLNPLGYCDSDWGTYPLTRHSLTMYLVTLGSTTISWKDKKSKQLFLDHLQRVSIVL